MGQGGNNSASHAPEILQVAPQSHRRGASPPPPTTTASMSRARAIQTAARAVSFLPGPSNIPTAPRALRTRELPAPALGAADALFLPDPRRPQHRPELLYSVSRFLSLPRNTAVPEVCLVGRSNVGKSTLINALAGMTSARAGRVTKALAKQADLSAAASGGAIPALAITSSSAGCTQTLNAYGFGPPPPPRRPDEGSDGGEEPGKEGGRSRGEQRRDTKTRTREAEPVHRHQLYLMDTPGYGLNSREGWGDEIVKYLNRRRMLRGAVLLIDSVAGVKDGDRLALSLLRRAGVRVAVVLTKGDKIMGADASGASADAAAGLCVDVWDELRAAERRPGPDWAEGQDKGWVREVFVSSAGGPVGLGVSGVRLLIGRLAGLLEDVPAEALPMSAMTTTAAAAASKIVSFDDIQFAPERSRPVAAAAPAASQPDDFDMFAATLARSAAASRGGGARKGGSPRRQQQPQLFLGEEPEQDLGFRPDATMRSSGAAGVGKNKNPSRARSYWDKVRDRQKGKNNGKSNGKSNGKNAPKKRGGASTKPAAPVDPFASVFSARAGGKRKSGAQNARHASF
ncbi:hypothetical protein RB594_001122 [Gaeumannomyces avenae]